MRRYVAAASAPRREDVCFPVRFAPLLRCPRVLICWNDTRVGGVTPTIWMQNIYLPPPPRRPLNFTGGKNHIHTQSYLNEVVGKETDRSEASGG